MMRYSHEVAPEIAAAIREAVDSYVARFRVSEEEAWRALSKIASVEMDLAIERYIEADVRRLVAAMISPRPVRCSAPHPDDPRRPCNARLFDAVPETVDVLPGADPPPGCTSVECRRCGTKYVACARAA